MPTVHDKVTRIIAVKADIKAAIEAKGPTVGSIPFDEYAGKIAEIADLSAAQAAVETVNGETSTDFTTAIDLTASTKLAIETAIETAGVDVPAGTVFADYAGKIGEIIVAPADLPTASGGVETEVGLYKYHTFLTNGVLTVTSAGTFELLIVGGGGGAAGDAGGGGGGGGVVNVNATLGVASFAVTVGAGGVGGDVTAASSGENGFPSRIANIVALGGGGGAGYSVAKASAGGSGGGGSSNNPAGQGFAGQGFAGGAAGPFSGIFAAGGGGGASSVGANGISTKTGDGGAGIEIFGDYYGGGGAAGYVGATSAAAGVGGIGGGGNSGLAGGNNAGQPGQPNTGGGGGGGHYETARATGGEGGSGIIIIRYLL